MQKIHIFTYIGTAISIVCASIAALSLAKELFDFSFKSFLIPVIQGYDWIIINLGFSVVENLADIFRIEGFYIDNDQKKGISFIVIFLIGPYLNYGVSIVSSKEGIKPKYQLLGKALCLFIIVMIMTILLGMGNIQEDELGIHNIVGSVLFLILLLMAGYLVDPESKSRMKTKVLLNLAAIIINSIGLLYIDSTF